MLWLRLSKGVAYPAQITIGLPESVCERFFGRSFCYFLLRLRFIPVPGPRYLPEQEQGGHQGGHPQL